MKTILTNTCKDYIVNGINGIKFQLKGFAFLVDKENLLGNDISNLKLNDIYHKNPLEDEDYLYTNPLKENTRLHNKLFDLTYVPSIELSTEKKDNFSTYKIYVDKSIFNGLKTEQSDDFDAIVLIGQVYDETKDYTIAQDTYFLAGFVIPEDDSFKINNIKQNSIVIDIQLSLLEAETNVSKLIINENYEKFEDISIRRDEQTVQIKSNDVFLTQSKNANYDNEISLIKGTSVVSENYLNDNIALVDTTDIIDNVWNPKAQIYILSEDKKYNKPLITLSYYNDDTTINHIALSYNKNNFTFNTIEQAENQIDIYPENIDEEHKECVKTPIKIDNDLEHYVKNPYNEEWISYNNSISSNKDFFRYKSFGGLFGKYTRHTFEWLSRYNIIGNYESIVTTPDWVENINFINSNENKLNSNCTGTTFIFSNNNYVSQKGCNDLFISTNDSKIKNIYNSTFINTDNLYSNIVPGSAYTLQNLTLIGKNNYTDFETPYKPNETISALSGYNVACIGTKGLICETNDDRYKIIFGKMNAFNSNPAYNEYDYAEYPIVRVGGGFLGNTKNFEISLQHQTELIADTFKLADTIKRMNLFSIEQNSHQFVYTGTNVTAAYPITEPATFVVRGREKATKFFNGQETHRKYNLQNALYTPTRIITPNVRSSNDGYPISISEIVSYKNTRTNQSSITNNYSISYTIQKPKTIICKMKNNGATNPSVRINITDIINNINKTYNTNIGYNELNGNDSTTYTIYLINSNKLGSNIYLSFQPYKYNSTTSKIESTRLSYSIAPCECIKIIYMDNGINGYGVMNWEYDNLG